MLLSAAPGASAAPGSAAGAPAGQATGNPKIEDKLQRRFASAPGKAQDFWVTFRHQADLADASRVADWGDRGRAVVTALRKAAHDSQTGTLNMLQARGVAYRSYWISNAVKVNGGTADLATALAARPEVTQVLAPTIYATPKPIDKTTASATAANLDWGLANINADDVWASGIDGNGIVVADLDTGVDYRHPALVNQYRGNNHDGTFTHDYNWFDASGRCTDAPCDGHGHGTHVMGTMVGDDRAGNRIGVAPGATWIAANGCDPCTADNLLTAGQWLLAPTRSNGSAAEPSKRPNVINNSWGSMSPSVDPWFDDLAAAWDAAGIFSVWSNGNIGPGCATAGAPGSRTARYSVGAYDANDTIAPFSSRGAGQDGLIKPDISAPGVNVRSAAAGSTGYVAMSGTSMAAPHVAGAIALLWSASPSLVGDIPTTRNLLDLTARDTEDLQCGGTPQDNNVYGEGRLDAAAFLANRQVGTVTGTVTQESGGPITGAQLVLTGGSSEHPIQRTAQTGPGGTYRIGMPAGAYNVKVTAYGFVGDETTLTITADTATTQNFTLATAPMVTVSGRVTDGSGHGWPVYAELTFPGYPANPVYSDPMTGEYSLRLPADADYDVTVDPVYDGYPATRETLSLGTTDRRFDRSVEIDTQACTAPGYGWNATEATFTGWQATTPQDGWQVTGKSGSWRFDNPAQRPQPGADNRFAIADPTTLGNKAITTTLTSPAVDLSGQTNPELSFDTRYLGTARQQASVEYSTDGSRWQTVWSAGGGSVIGRQTVSLAQIANRPEVRIRLTFAGPAGGYWAVDNLFIGTRTCVLRAGGMLVGQVADAAGQALPGVEIRVESNTRDHAVSREFPDDVNLAGRTWYWLFSPVRTTQATATRPGYRVVAADVTITRDRLIRHDFQLEPIA
ncbi:S8 family serine peptidase [Micromonospora sp. NPDC047465]|uniref:S8 family serine peptidase n=1 Tax=Micromonospora sp. NPDC047465 TaxID=3154813 RepID=UPI0033C00433